MVVVSILKEIYKKNIVYLTVYINIQMFSPLRKWIIENKFFIKHGDQPITHLLLNGGKCLVSQKNIQKILGNVCKRN